MGIENVVNKWELLPPNVRNQLDLMAQHHIQKNLFNEEMDYSTEKSPSKFWLVCPAEMVDRTEIPEYWGLYYIRDDKAEKRKRAKAIHLEKEDSKTLLDLSHYVCSRYWRSY